MDFNIETFTKNVVIYLFDTVAETIEFNMAESDALNHIHEAFDRLVYTMSDKGINLSDFKHDNKFLKDAAIEMMLIINEDDANYENIKNKYLELIDNFKELNIDFLKLNEEELEEYGFAKWLEFDPLMLIPIWAYRLLPKGIKLTSINKDEEKIFSEKIKVDYPKHIRFGHLGWGFYIDQDIAK